MHRTTYTLSILLLFVATGSLFAQAVSIETFDGTVGEFTLSSIGEDGQIQGENVPEGMSVGDLLSLTNSAPEALPVRPVKVLLANDGQIFVSNLTCSGPKAQIISQTIEGDLPLEAIAAVIWTDSPKVKTALSNPSSENDQVVVDTGEERVIVAGLLEEITADKVVLNYRGESRKIKRDIVHAIVTANLQPPSPTGTKGSVRLVDGSVINGSIKSYENQLWQIGIDNLNTISVKHTALETIDIESDRIRFAHTLKPVDLEQRDYFSVRRPPQFNKSVTGDALVLTGPTPDEPQEFNRGIGMQSFTRMVFDIPDGFDRFQTVVGISDFTQGRGDCEVIISADGVQLWKDRLVGRQEGKPVDIDVTGSRQLTLIVQPGKQYDFSDHVNFCNARFLNTQK